MELENVTFDPLKYEYPSRRGVIYGAKGMVATSQNLAAEAGLDILKKGGNAIDAAIATAAVLAVVEPMCNSIGSDSFALVWVDGKLHGLNASGPAPKLASREAVLAKGIEEIPEYGMVPMTVPGTVSGWVEMSEKFGKLPFEELLEPAIRYAEEGFPVSPITAWTWEQCFDKFYRIFDLEKNPEYAEWFKEYAPLGRAPKAGEIWKSQATADTLKKIAATKGEAFYSGELADKMSDFCEKNGGFLRKEDLASYKAEWVEPIKVNYRGYDVWEIPPNGHGIVALMALNILNNFELGPRDSADTYHKQLEAMKLAFVDGKRYVADPKFMKVSVEQLLSPEYAKERAALIGEKAIMPEVGKPDKGGTVYLATADEEGNMVSFIQSCYWNFGSGVVVPGTGICMQNRGHNFSMDPEAENCIGSGKKSYHTIIPSFLTKDGEAIGPFGVMGAFMQPQGHVQVVMNTVDFHLNPQQALDAPRWQWVGDKEIWVERNFPYAATEELERRGHEVKVPANFLDFGRGQIIWRLSNGTYIGGTEPRGDGCVAAW